MSTNPRAHVASAAGEDGVREHLHHVVFVDDEEDILFVARGFFAAQFPWIHLETFSDPAAALSTLRVEPPDLLITDLRMPKISGIELIWRARELQPWLPVVLVTAFGTRELREGVARKRAMTFVDKPFTAATLRAAVLQAASGAWREQRPPNGDGMLQGVFDLVQLHALAGVTGRLDLVHTADEAKIWFEHGAIVHAEHGAVVGEAAASAALEWVGGAFTFHTGDTAPQVTVRGRWQQMLLEGYSLFEEAHRLDDEPDPKVPATSPANVQKNAAEEPREKGNKAMANVKETLSKLGEVDGFIGACVVDANSGMMLGAEGGGSINLEVAAAGNTEVVRAKRKTMANTGLKDTIEDILITLGKHYHLIRPLATKDGLFIYLALDRSKGNLAMARHQLAEAEKALSL